MSTPVPRPALRAARTTTVGLDAVAAACGCDASALVASLRALPPRGACAAGLDRALRDSRDRLAATAARPAAGAPGAQARAAHARVLSSRVCPPPQRRSETTPTAPPVPGVAAWAARSTTDQTMTRNHATRMAQHPNKYTRVSVFPRLRDTLDTVITACPALMIVRLSDDPDPGVRASTAACATAPTAILRRFLAEMSNSGATGSLSSALANPACPPDVLTAHAGSDVLVRSTVSQHPNTPVETLRQLRADPDSRVRHRAAQNLRQRRVRRWKQRLTAATRR